jgi:pyrimidine operon attenuation protein/uracil phosphoribosyltransferase
MELLPAGKRTCLYDPAHMAAVMDSMARQAAGLLSGCDKVAIIGVLRRGAPLADMLSQLLVTQYHLAKPVRLDLSVKRYADDLTLLHPDTQLRESQQIANIDLSGYTLLLVDDVLYTGHSILRVVEYLSKKHPAQIRVACLADRKVSTLPIKADIVGVELQIAPEDVVECHIPPYEPTFEVDLLQLEVSKKQPKIR